MALTVSEALQLSPINEGVLVAGANGVGHAIESVTVLEVLDFRFLTPQIFAISSLYAIANDVDEQISFIRRLHRLHVSALALFNVGSVMPCISDQLIAVCDELGFPLINMPAHISYYDTFNVIIDRLLAHQVHKLKDSVKIYETFTNHLMRIEGDISLLLDTLSKMIHAKLTFFDHNHKRMYSSWKTEEDPLSKERLLWIQEIYSSAADNRQDPSFFDINGTPFLLQPVRSHDTHYGVLIIEGLSQPLPDLISLAITQTCRTLCIALLNNERQAEYRIRKRYEYLHNLILGNFSGDRSMILSQGRALHYNIADVDRVLVISVAQKSGENLRAENIRLLQFMEAQISRVFTSTISLLLQDSSELVLLSAKKRPKDLIYMGKWIASQLLSENAEAEVGISPVCDGPESFSFGYRKAQQAICIGKKLFPQSAVSYVFYDDIKIFALLQESIDRDKAIAVVSELFDTVDQYDKANNSQLGQTFFELLINNLSTSHVSQQMFLHKNTVLQRKNKIAGFYDADPFEGPNHLRYELGFILKRLFEP